MARGDEQAVVVGIAARILEENLPELRIRPEEIGWESVSGDSVRSRQPIRKVSKIADVICIEVGRPPVQIGGTHHL